MQMQNSGSITVKLRIKPEMTSELVSGSSRAVTLGSSIFLFLPSPSSQSIRQRTQLPKTFHSAIG